MTITLPSPLVFEDTRAYRINIPYDTFRSACCNRPFEAVPSWRFYAGNPTFPTAVVLSPDKGAINVPALTATLSMQFSEYMQFGVPPKDLVVTEYNTPSFVMHQVFNNTTVTLINNVASWTISPVVDTRQFYMVAIANDTFRAFTEFPFQGYPASLGSPEAWTFSSPNGLDAPVVLANGGLYPSNISVSFSKTETHVYITFDINVVLVDLGVITFYSASDLENDTITLPNLARVNVQTIGSSGRGNNVSIALQPGYLKDGKVYYITISNTAIRSHSGAAFAGYSEPFQWRFTTSGFSNPVIVNRDPLINEPAAEIGRTNITLFFRYSAIRNAVAVSAPC